MSPVNVSVPRAGGHRFSEVPKAEIQRAAFDRSFGVKTAFDAGLLIPFFVDEALPGDTFNVKLQAFARLLSPLKAPIMDNLYLETFFFSVPNRLVWENWQRFCGEQDDPGDSTDYTVPRLADGSTVPVGSIADYFGIPVGLQTTNNRVSALPFRAYFLIYNEWFRDQNLVDHTVVSKGDGPDGWGTATPLQRGKRHDYFTSCLPWPQKDTGTSPTIPLGGLAPVIGMGVTTTVWTAGPASPVYESNQQTTSYTGYKDSTGSTANAQILLEEGPDGYPAVFADLSDATGATINELRQAFQIQRLLERDARGGTRYTEIIRAHFNVTSDDARLQRPEYLGGGRSMVHISPIAQTSSTDATTPQGNLTAVGTAEISGHGFAKSFTEHCTIIGLVSVRADLSYQQGLERMWSRETRYDFYWPALAHLGEQAVLNREIYVSNTPATDDAVFGYQERYAEYRYKPSQITGIMRSNVADSLDVWHLTQDFDSTPVLNSSFILEDPPIERVVADTTAPHFIMDAFVRMRTARPMPLYGVPGMLDHF